MSHIPVQLLSVPRGGPSIEPKPLRGPIPCYFLLVPGTPTFLLFWNVAAPSCLRTFARVTPSPYICFVHPLTSSKALLNVTFP